MRALTTHIKAISQTLALTSLFLVAATPSAFAFTCLPNGESVIICGCTSDADCPIGSTCNIGTMQCQAAIESATTPEMSDYAAMTFILAASGVMVYLRRRALQ